MKTLVDPKLTMKKLKDCGQEVGKGEEFLP